MKDTCPNCGVVLEKQISRKTRCPHCSKYILVRAKKLVTEDDAFIIDWSKYMDFLVPDIERVKLDVQKMLRIKFGKKPSSKDVVWGMFNRLALDLKSYDSLEILYTNMAKFLKAEGKPEKAQKMEDIASKMGEKYDAFVEKQIDNTPSVFDKKEKSLAPNDDGDFSCLYCGRNMGKPSTKSKLFGKPEKFLRCGFCKLRYDIV